MFTPVAENTRAVLKYFQLQRRANRCFESGWWFQHVSTRFSYSSSSYVNYVHPKENLQQLAIPKAD